MEGLESAALKKRGRGTVSEREAMLAEQIAAMQKKLEAIQNNKLDEQAKKLDKVWKRVRVHCLSIGLTNISVEAFETLISENVERLKKV